MNILSSGGKLQIDRHSCTTSSDLSFGILLLYCGYLPLYLTIGLQTCLKADNCGHVGQLPLSFPLHTFLPKCSIVSSVSMSINIKLVALVLALHRRFKYWACGHMFLPPEGSDHYDYLQLQFYEQSFVTIVQAFQK